MARKHVTVALAGDGGDELFLGYGMYKWAQRMANPWVRSLHKPLAMALAAGNNRMKRGAMVFDYASEARKKSHIFSQEQYLFSEKEIQALLLPDYQRSLQFDEGFLPLARPLSAAEEQSLFDAKNYLKDDLLVKVDIASMQHALEVRVPLIDYRVVAFALNLHESLRWRNGESKWLLKQVLYEMVPAEIFNRPKWGFSIPLVNWLQHELRYLLEELLSEKRVREAGMVQPAVVENLKKRFLGGESHLYNRLWALMMLHQWAR
jgi:asparagine synthase (glutamine-hydrolysing)